MRRRRSILFLLVPLVAGATLATIASCSKSAGDGASSMTGPATALCAPPPDAVTRCSGDDPTFVFFPALGCDPASRGEAGTADSQAGGEAGAGALDPCAGVTTLDVFFTPQACRAFVSAEATAQIDQGPAGPGIDEPSDGDMLTADHWAIFVWHKAASGAHGGGLRRLGDWLEPTAHAYSPIRGDAYVLEFSQGCTEILQVMLAETSWTPDPASWNRLTSVGGPVQVRVFALRLMDDALAATPLVSPSITITMQGNAGD